MTTDWFKVGENDAEKGRPPVKPTETKSDRTTNLLLTIVTLGAAAPAWAYDEHLDSEKTPEADRDYSKGYRSRISTEEMHAENKAAYERTKK